MAIHLPLTQGQTAIIDDNDYHLISCYKWRAKWNSHSKTFYAISQTGRRSNGSRKVLYMHRIILHMTDTSLLVDHRNHIGTDNRRSNLRMADQFSNAAHARKKVGTSRYKGVYWHSSRKKWYASIRVKRKRRFLGSFESEEEAAAAYNQAARSFFGEFAVLNNVKEPLYGNYSKSPATAVGHHSAAG